MYQVGELEAVPDEEYLQRRTIAGRFLLLKGKKKQIAMGSE